MYRSEDFGKWNLMLFFKYIFKGYLHYKIILCHKVALDV